MYLNCDSKIFLLVHIVQSREPRIGYGIRGDLPRTPLRHVPILLGHIWFGIVSSCAQISVADIDPGSPML